MNHRRIVTALLTGALTITSVCAAHAEAYPWLHGNNKQETSQESAAKTGEAADESVIERAEEILAGMTTEQKVAQLFCVTPEALNGVTGDSVIGAVDQYPVGAVIYFEYNLSDEGTTQQMLSELQAHYTEVNGFPIMLGVDEEGGTVLRVGGRDGFSAPYTADMAEVALSGSEAVRSAGSTIGSYLKDLGFTVDFAPCADVLTNPENTVVARRSFGSDPVAVAEDAVAFSEGLHEYGILSTYKHFPGHGATAGDSHAGFAYTDKTLDQMMESELLPFTEENTREADLVMVGHISAPNVTGSDTPASVSYTMITSILREKLGYDGLVTTDAMNMGAISNTYSSSEAAVMTIQAGADMVMMPADFGSAYAGVLAAVQDGRITSRRLDESVMRILTAKLGQR